MNCVDASKGRDETVSRHKLLGCLSEFHEKRIKMEWTRSETLAQAAPGCNTCLGLGLRIGRHETTHPCNCVLRAIFRACFEHFRDCVSRERYISKVTLDPLPGKDRRGAWGRKSEEFSADFCLVSKRTLTEPEYERSRSTAFLNTTSFWERTGNCAAGNSTWTAGISSMRCTGLSRSWGGCSVNWSRIRCFLLTITCMVR
jgi:hypothetical protein